MTRIHVDARAIRDNRRDGGDRPVVAVRQGATVTLCHGARILDGGREVCRVVYERDSAGRVKVWMETACEVQCDLDG